MGGFLFEEVEEGDEITPLGLRLTRDDVRRYTRAANIAAARFTDDEAARKEGLPGMIAPGVMSLGLLVRMIGEWNRAALVKRASATFRSPVLPDCDVHIGGAITQKNPQDRTVECDLWMENGEGERWVIGTATVALPGRP